MTEPRATLDMLGRSALISVPAAQQILLDHLAGSTVDVCSLPLAEAFDRVLAQPVAAPEDLPAQARSTMDGFAVRAADTFGASESMPCYLSITGEVAMGTAPTLSVDRGCCLRIPTGGLLPAGADAVVMLEHTVPVDESLVEMVKGVGAGSNLIQRGEDIRAGDQALPAGRLLRPQDIGLLAGLGIATVTVYRRPRVAILATGDEIIPHEGKPQPGQIRNINSLTLAGLVRRAGGLAVDCGIVSDRRDLFLPAITRAVAEHDMVLFSGGSSVGARDLGEEVIAALGPPGILVHGVTLKPGKPVLIGMSGTTPVFGLPGHPVSAMVCFDYFVAPALHRLAGREVPPPLPETSLPARLSRNTNSAAGRRDVVRVRLVADGDGWLAEPVPGKSGSISTLSRAHGYFEIDEASQGVPENSTVKVFLYR